MKNHLLILLLLFTAVGRAQHLPYFGFYKDLAPFYNPAMSGLDHDFRASLLYRNQWTGLLGAPLSYVGQVGEKLKELNSGIGLNVIHEEIGFNKYTAITGNYNYQFSFNDDQSYLSVGVAPKIFLMQFPNLNIDSSGIATPVSWIRSNAYTMNAGMTFQTEKLTIGLSAMNLIPTRQQLSEELHFNHTLHLSIMASYAIQLAENMKLIPNFHFQSDMNVLNSYVAVRVEHQKLWYQFGVHNRLTLNASLGYRFLDRINIGYMIEYTSLAPIFPYVWSHEAFIAFELDY